MKEQVKFQNGVNASIDKWSMLSARRKKRLMIRSATVVGAVVLVWRVDHCTKNLISCRLRVWTICLCYQDHKRLQYIDFTCWKAEICIIGIFISCNKISNRSFLNLSDMKTYVTMLCLWHFLKHQWWFMWIWIFSTLPKQQTLCNAIMYWVM